MITSSQYLVVKWVPAIDVDNSNGDGKSQFVFPWISYSAIEERFMLEMSEQIMFLLVLLSKGLLI